MKPSKMPTCSGQAADGLVMQFYSTTLAGEKRNMEISLISRRLLLMDRQWMIRSALESVNLPARACIRWHVENFAAQEQPPVPRQASVGSCEHACQSSRSPEIWAVSCRYSKLLRSETRRFGDDGQRHVALKGAENRSIGGSSTTPPRSSSLHQGKEHDSGSVSLCCAPD